MRIVHALRSDGFAGVERHVCTLAAAQVAAGHEVIVLGGGVGPTRSALAGSGVVHMSAATVRQLTRHRALLESADVVHTHMTAAESAMAMSFKGSRRRPRLVSTRHFARRRGSSMAGRAVSPLVSRALDGQIAISAFVAEAIDGPSTVIYPGVDTTVLGPPEQRQRVLLLLQRLEVEKEADVALRAFARADMAGWRVAVVGKGGQKSHLMQLSQALGIAHEVDWLGFQDDVAGLLAQAGALIAPCRVEGLGLSVLEAMASGLPVVAAGAGAYVETVGRAQDPMLFRPGHAAEAADLLTELAASVERRKQYGVSLQQVQRQHFTVKSQVAATDAFYEQVRG